MPQRVHDEMLDALVLLWPENEREFMKFTLANRLAEHYGARWKHKESCLNCDALMYRYSYTINKTSAKALQQFADAVVENMRKGKAFTEANRIHIATLPDVSFSRKSQMTILKYHGLIAKYVVGGRHKDSLWVVTTWGWEFLNGTPRSREVTVWRKNIIDRSEEKITMRAALDTEGNGYDELHYRFAIQDGRIF